MVGIDWPNIDEDELRSIGDAMRQLSQELDGHAGEAKSDIEQMMQNNSSQSLELFEALWNKLAGSHLPQMAQGMNIVADALDVGAVVVVGLKVAAIAQLVMLAAEIISDQAEAVVTFGGSEALIPIQTTATREIMKTIEDQAVQQFEQQLLSAIEGPVIDALTGVAKELGKQLLGDAVGVSSGLDLGKAACCRRGARVARQRQARPAEGVRRRRASGQRRDVGRGRGLRALLRAAAPIVTDRVPATTITVDPDRYIRPAGPNRHCGDKRGPARP